MWYWEREIVVSGKIQEVRQLVGFFNRDINHTKKNLEILNSWIVSVFVDTDLVGIALMFCNIINI